jgi:hypothetical protein
VTWEYRENPETHEHYDAFTSKDHSCPSRQCPPDSSGCYWERTKDDSGDTDSIIANDTVNPGTRASITVNSGEFFKSSGCGTWTRV